MSESSLLERPDVPTGPIPTVLEAIVRCRCVAASYNRTQIVMAPHVIYTRHGELYVDGVTLERDGQLPREAKVSTFKLIGLSPLEITERGFEPHPLFEPEAERYAGTTLMMVEKG